MLRDEFLSFLLVSLGRTFELANYSSYRAQVYGRWRSFRVERAQNIRWCVRVREYRTVTFAALDVLSTYTRNYSGVYK